MSIPSQAGQFSFAPQGGKIGEGNAFVSGDHTWYRMKANRITTYTQEENQLFPLEVSGLNTYTGAFKQAQYFQGQIDFIPRLENSLGWILYAVFGDVTTTANQNYYGDTVTGLYTHTFKLDATQSYATKWIAARCFVPGSYPDDSDAFMESGIDTKVGSFRLTIPAKGKIVAQMGLLGRETEYEVDPTLVYGNTLEDSQTTVDAGYGSFKIGGASYGIQGMTFDFMNNLSTPDEEAINGQFTMDDIIAKSKVAQVRFVYKWQDSQLYQRVLTGSNTGTAWTTAPLIQDTANGETAFECVYKAPATVGNTGENYTLRINANRVVIQPEPGSMQMVGNGILSMAFTMTLLEPLSGDFIHFAIENGQSAYTWPAAHPQLEGRSQSRYAGGTTAATGNFLDAGMKFWDEDNGDFNTGTIVVTLSGDLTPTTDAIDISGSGNWTNVAGELQYNGVAAADLVATTPGSVFTITFDASVTKAQVRELLQDLVYYNTGGNVGGNVVTANVLVTDPDANANGTGRNFTITHNA